MFLQRAIEQRGGGFVVDVGAAFGFGNYAIDAAQFLQVFGGDAHGFSGEGFFAGIAPHDGGAAFG